MTTQTRIEAFYEDALAHGRYDFRVGRKLSSVVGALGFEVREFDLQDDELSFAGPAPPDVLEAWRRRLARMGGLKHFFGTNFTMFQTEFLHCLSSKDHRSRCRVLGCVATRQLRGNTAVARAPSILG